MPTKANVLTRTGDFIKWFLPKIEKFPRNYKFLFGDRLVQIQLDVLENLIEAYYRKEKLANLQAANIGLEKLRHLLQISTEMRFMRFGQLEYTTRSLKVHNRVNISTSTVETARAVFGDTEPSFRIRRCRSMARIWSRATCPRLFWNVTGTRVG